MIYLLLILGFILLVKGADFFVEGAADIARLFRIPSVIIGLTIVAIGTSAPEAAVSITAGFARSNDIALGNVIGSNIFNILVVVGICGVIKTFDINSHIIKRDFWVVIFSTGLLLVFILDRSITAFEGYILLFLMFVYILSMINLSLKSRTENCSNYEEISVIKCILFTVFGIAAVILGGQLVVDNAVKIAESFNVSENLIGLTIVAVGTSLPELVTSIAAAKKGNSGLALGNVIGSNIFNILFIIGASSVLNPINAAEESILDVVVSLIITLLIFLWCRFRKCINFLTGIIMLICYFGYTFYIFLR
jgi:K+-dependent Na+/Ca+ exchanger family protein